MQSARRASVKRPTRWRSPRVPTTVWGPIAGYFAREEKPPLIVTSIAGSPEARLPMTFDIAMGVRWTDRALKAEADRALSSLAPQIKAILASYGVPVAWEAAGGP